MILLVAAVLLTTGHPLRTPPEERCALEPHGDIWENCCTLCARGYLLAHVENLDHDVLFDSIANVVSKVLTHGSVSGSTAAVQNLWVDTMYYRLLEEIWLLQKNLRNQPLFPTCGVCVTEKECLESMSGSYVDDYHHICVPFRNISKPFAPFGQLEDDFPEHIDFY